MRYEFDISAVLQCLFMMTAIVALAWIARACTVEQSTDANRARVQCVQTGRPIAECALLFGRGLQ